MSALCPNSSGVLFHVYHLTPAQRRALFFGVCAPLRLSGAYAAYRFPPLVPLLVVFAAVSVLKLAIDVQANHATQWWSKTWELLIAVLVVFSFLNLSESQARRVVPSLIAAGVLGGIVQALLRGFC